MAITLAPVAVQPSAAHGANAPTAQQPDGNDSFQAALSRGMEHQSAREAPAQPGKPGRHDAARAHGQATKANQAEPAGTAPNAPTFDLVALLAQSGMTAAPAETAPETTATEAAPRDTPDATAAMPAPAADFVPVDGGVTPLALPVAQPLALTTATLTPDAEPASATTQRVALAASPAGASETPAALARPAANDAHAPAFALPAGVAPTAAQPGLAQAALAQAGPAQSGRAQADGARPEPARTDVGFRPVAQAGAPRAEASAANRPEAQIAHATPQASARAETVAAAPSAVALPDAGGAQFAAAMPLAASNVAANLPPGFVNTPPLQGRIDAPFNTPAWGQSLNQQISWMVSGAHQSAELQLHPADLGPVQVVLSIENQKAELMFVAREPAVREALEASLPRLKDMFAAAGIQLGQASVSAEQQPRGDSPQAGAQSRRNEPIGGEQAVLTAPVRTVTHRGLVDTFA